MKFFVSKMYGVHYKGDTQKEKRTVKSFVILPESTSDTPFRVSATYIKTFEFSSHSSDSTKRPKLTQYGKTDKFSKSLQHHKTDKSFQITTTPQDKHVSTSFNALLRMR